LICSLLKMYRSASTLSDARWTPGSSVAGFAWATLACNVGVVLWGAYVRATGSGAGCGNKWPLCGGDLVGAGARAQTIIEFTHRASSGIVLMMVAVLVVWCWRATSKHNWARYSAVAAAIFLANEALLGAALVLLDHVAQDKSTGRIVFLCLHFGNTLLLLASLALTAAWLSKGSPSFRPLQKPGEVMAVVIGLLATMIVGITGAVAALGDTLFPATSLRSSLVQDFSRGAPPLLHYRLLHPAAAILATCYLVWLVSRMLTRGHLSHSGMALVILLPAQIAAGILNVLLLAPVWLQIVHLFIGDAVWIVLVLASADLLLQPANAPATSARPARGLTLKRFA
jgi:heme a synthase